MAKSYRPYRRARPDKNHQIISRALKNWGGGFSQDDFGVWSGHVRGLSVSAYDTSKMGGEMVDWLVSVSWLTIAFEVKQERPKEKETDNPGSFKRELSDREYYWNMLKEGERQFILHSPMIKFIVHNEEGVWVHILETVAFVLYVEDKVGLDEPYLDLFFPKLKEMSEDEKFNKSWNGSFE